MLRVSMVPMTLGLLAFWSVSSIQHPLAESWMELEAAELMAMKAAWLYDNGQPCGPHANAAKYLAAEAALKACTRAVKTHGGMGSGMMTRRTQQSESVI